MIGLKRSLRRLERAHVKVSPPICPGCQMAIGKPPDPNAKPIVTFAGGPDDDPSKDRCPACNRLLVLRLEFD